MYSLNKLTTLTYKNVTVNASITTEDFTEQEFNHVLLKCFGLVDAVQSKDIQWLSDHAECGKIATAHDLEKLRVAFDHGFITISVYDKPVEGTSSLEPEEYVSVDKYPQEEKNLELEQQDDVVGILDDKGVKEMVIVPDNSNCQIESNETKEMEHDLLEDIISKMNVLTKVIKGKQTSKDSELTEETSSITLPLTSDIDKGMYDFFKTKCSREALKDIYQIYERYKPLEALELPSMLKVSVKHFPEKREIRFLITNCGTTPLKEDCRLRYWNDEALGAGDSLRVSLRKIEPGCPVVSVGRYSKKRRYFDNPGKIYMAIRLSGSDLIWRADGSENEVVFYNFTKKAGTVPSHGIF
ncbi:uncharacterized protein NDAI_0B02810 [Naumovozyma dairenensis CBS 421]|uniref:Uncharacterized protein n=1 Tax=Naumovozyma dairenensis (strain ATCC 10597 / BCRC 20456 / CBS 421 / NBRC 0211 / NRRL Y-12639) TaxID=1071378 RepID=G0W6A5_NAUDC|nr:hypothetical protein NDAI_0B02810 [Naumovozyma dairenensis CBS 421]CCD23316.1 hypothetical protein NDAI_0B02810 [Naumovozyma dairenensis CBS 421]